MSSIDFSHKDQNHNPVFTTETGHITFEGVRAALWGEGLEISTIIWGRTQEGDIYLLDSWESSLTENDFTLEGKVKLWAEKYSLQECIFAKIPDMPESSEKRQHPIAKHITEPQSVECCVITNFAPYDGLVSHKNLVKGKKLKTQYFPNYKRIIEKIRRLDPKATGANAIEMAFLLAMSNPGGCLSPLKRLEILS